MYSTWFSKCVPVYNYYCAFESFSKTYSTDSSMKKRCPAKSSCRCLHSGAPKSWHSCTFLLAQCQLAIVEGHISVSREVFRALKADSVDYPKFSIWGRALRYRLARYFCCTGWRVSWIVPLLLFVAPCMWCTAKHPHSTSLPTPAPEWEGRRIGRTKAQFNRWRGSGDDDTNNTKEITHHLP